MMITILSGGTDRKLIQFENIVDAEDINIIVNTVKNDYFSEFIFLQILMLCFIHFKILLTDLWYGIKDDAFITNERLSEIILQVIENRDKDQFKKLYY